MELSEVKKLITLAKRYGVKQISVGETCIMFWDKPEMLQKPLSGSEDESLPVQLKTPTLAQINEYIYGVSQAEQD